MGLLFYYYGPDGRGNYSYSGSRIKSGTTTIVVWWIWSWLGIAGTDTLNFKYLFSSFVPWDVVYHQVQELLAETLLTKNLSVKRCSKITYI